MGKIISKYIKPIESLEARLKKRNLTKIAFIVFAFLCFVGLIIINRFLPDSRKKEGVSVSKQITENPQSTSPKEKYVPKPTPELTIPESENVEVSGVQVNNFYKEAEIINANGDLSINTQTKDYAIIYFPSVEQFNISITISPFDEIKTQAETAFINIMGVEKNELCKLKVVITTPYFANPQEAGKVYGLSFCQ
ncbi:hypothetical protein A2Z22_02870 [Candidatus Woesebacteria bacterium RBG_16_34_12]|uniref:Uncharacterized protein n=1 Tax=Candidatus Woesebacteria bacterium RBG_16_34_12 TaxID=1802480 RepID=A0A1F7X6U1_9BACT|nr:MAG: hypothetical protein A2Z22_02870 [Candidatus Woesebacteria bacterium RBG_16_34_12]